MQDSTQSEQYTRVAIILHWLIGLSIVGLLGMGLILEDLPEAWAGTAYMLHKSMGLSVLVLSLFRIFWRLTHTAPALPAGMKPWETWAAHGVHVGLYLLMIGLPMSGWALVSSSPHNYPLQWFGLFDWPKLPVLTEIVNKEEVSESFGEVHETLAWIAITLIALHIGAALKHHFIARDDLLARMVPSLRNKG